MSGFALDRVTKHRHQPEPDGEWKRVPVLSDISAELPSGELTLVMGPSGCGKSTLLRLMNRLEEPDSGEIRWDGQPIREISPVALRRKVVLVGQRPAPFPGSVFDNLAYGLRLMRLPANEIEERVREAFQPIGLPENRLKMDADKLSVGQQQRVCLARALALRPQALLLDEPTASLDPESAETILDLIQEWRESRKMTILYVTHRLEDARSLGGKTLSMSEGKVVEFGETRQLLDSPDSRLAKLFRRDSPDRKAKERE
jgi:ABC-type phosphate transport system ATPase subunit